jgi:hypothetical protein
MAVIQILKCDLCRRPTEKIVGKLFYAPVKSNDQPVADRGNYTHSAHVGICCRDKLFELQWNSRKTKAEYLAVRRNRF